MTVAARASDTLRDEAGLVSRFHVVPGPAHGPSRQHSRAGTHPREQAGPVPPLGSTMAEPQQDAVKLAEAVREAEAEFYRLKVPPGPECGERA